MSVAFALNFVFNCFKSSGPDNTKTASLATNVWLRVRTVAHITCVCLSPEMQLFKPYYEAGRDSDY